MPSEYRKKKKRKIHTYKSEIDEWGQTDHWNQRKALFVIYGGMLFFTYLAAGFARAAQVEGRRPCGQFAVIRIVFAHANVVVFAQTDVSGRGPVS